jgi:tetratricopeptide (TPR) repeat protein
MNVFDFGWVLNLFSSGDIHTHDATTEGKLVCWTSYGLGEVVETRRGTDGTITVRQKESTDWNTPIDVNVVNSNLDIHSEPAVGNVVICIYGRGRVLEVRPEKQQVAVRLSSWRLAGSWVTCYLSISAVQVVCDRKVYEMTVDEKVLYAQAIKEEGAREFAEKDYEGALRTYARAVENMSHVHEAPEKVLVDVVLLSITCSNNAGTCCCLLEQWDEAARFAGNALVLIESLEPKQHQNRHKRMLHAMLSKSGYTDSKLFGEWRAKSLLTMTKAFVENKKYEEALGMIKEARVVIDKYTGQEYVKQPALLGSIKILRANGKQAKKLKKVCKEHLKEILKAEQKQQIDALYLTPVRTAAGEEKKDESDPHHSVSPETTRVLNRALCSLAPLPPFINEDFSESDSHSVATLLSSSPKDDKATAVITKEIPVPPLDDAVAVSSCHLDARTLAGIVVVTGGIGLTIMGLKSTSRRSK